MNVAAFHFKKIRDTKRTFHAKISTIKDRNGMDLTEAEDTLRRGGRMHRRTSQKEILMTWITTMV